MKIGIVGFSRNKFDKSKAFKILDSHFSMLKEKHNSKQVEIVSGYSNSGIPKIAYQLADRYKFKTVGFSANQVFKVKSGVYPIDREIITGEKFGDESIDFVKYIDGLIRIGGGKQSRNEVKLFKQLHQYNNLESRLKEYEVDWYGEKPQGTGLNIPGLVVLENFISEKEQICLIEYIDSGKWLDDLKRRVQHFGYKYDYRSRGINANMKVDDLPNWIDGIKNRLQEFNLTERAPDQMIVNEYFPGQGIANHIDCEPCFDDTIISLSLNSATEMEFTNSTNKEKLSTILNPKSLLVLKDESRYKWKHGIPARKSDLINGRRIKRGRRISLTFRNVILST